MSYILEAIKKAEHERDSRGVSRLAKHIESSETHKKNRIPWVAIAIFINALILMLWLGYQILFINQDSNSNVMQEQKVPESESSFTASESTENLLAENTGLTESQFRNEESTREADAIKEVVKNKQDIVAENAITEQQIENNAPITKESSLREVDNRTIHEMIDNAIDEEVPVFFSVKQQDEHQESTHIDEQAQGSNDLVSSAETKLPLVETAKVEPLPKVTLEELAPQTLSQDEDSTGNEPARIQCGHQPRTRRWGRNC